MLAKFEILVLILFTNDDIMICEPEGDHAAMMEAMETEASVIRIAAGGKDIKKKDLSAKSGVSPATITKMGKGGHVTTEVLMKICTALDCGVDDIMEIVQK